jgi:bifunctional UDP-N-acetylglucosamine pyrophosphorylase/glucosamine-1-phosphate N-acetyltransferase
VAPITLGEGVTVGAGSTLTKDVPAGALALGRARQLVKENWSTGAPRQQQGVAG